MNERKPSWVCPVCDQKAYYEDLFQDGLFTKIIGEGGSYDDIVFFEDGSWRPLDDIQMGAEGARPLAETRRPAPAVAPPAQPVDIAAPATPESNVSSPQVQAISSAATSQSSPQEVPQQQQQQQTSTSQSSQANSQHHVVPESTGITESSSGGDGNADANGDAEEEIEVICIDDSDSDDDTPTATTNNTNDVGQNTRCVPDGSSGGAVYNTPSTNNNSDLCQPFELYNILAQSGEHAAPPQVYMDQNTMMGQLSSVTQQQQHQQQQQQLQQQQQQQQPPVNDVIDLSDWPSASL